MHRPEPGEDRLLQPGKRAKDTLLLTDPKLGLEAHQVEENPSGVFLPELNDRVGTLPSSGIDEPNRLHGPVGEGIPATPGDFLDR